MILDYFFFKYEEEVKLTTRLEKTTFKKPSFFSVNDLSFTQTEYLENF